MWAGGVFVIIIVMLILTLKHIKRILKNRKLPLIQDISIFCILQEHIIPKEIGRQNSLRVCSLYNSIHLKGKYKDNKKMGGFSVPPHWYIFILFKGVANYRQNDRRCNGSEEISTVTSYFLMTDMQLFQLLEILPMQH